MKNALLLCLFTIVGSFIAAVVGDLLQYDIKLLVGFIIGIWFRSTFKK